MLQTIADEIWGRPCLAYHVQPSLEPEARDAFEAVQRAFAALWPEPLHVGPKHGLHVTIYPLLTVWGDYDKDAYWQSIAGRIQDASSRTSAPAIGRWSCASPASR